MEIELAVLAEHLDDLNNKLAPTASNMPIILALNATVTALAQADEMIDQQKALLSSSIDGLFALSKVMSEKEAELNRLTGVEEKLKAMQGLAVEADRLLSEAMTEFTFKDNLIAKLTERVQNLSKATPLVSTPASFVRDNFLKRFSYSPDNFRFNWFAAGWRAAEHSHKIQNINN